ncbi:MAG: hypothetical protein ACJ764_12420 [Solirubrobacteraceae bacterium]
MSDIEAGAVTSAQTGAHRHTGVSLVVTGGTQWDRRELIGRLDRDQFNSITETSGAAEAVEALSVLGPSVCLLAGKVRGGTLAAITRLRASSPETRIALVVDSADQDRGLWAIRAGADGYLSRGMATDRLATAVSALAEGEALIPRELSTQVVRELQSGPAPDPGGRRSRIGYVLLYPARFIRHLRRRRRSKMRLGSAWRSARERMDDYS